MTELRKHGSIDVFDQRVNDAFGMDEDVDALARQAEQPVRLDDLETLVHHRRRIHADLPSHYPVRMGTGFVSTHRMEFLQRTLAERSTRRGEKNAADAGLRRIACIACRQALKDRVVLAIERQQRRTPL